ncbi:hypothetical protein [Streptomyces sp. cg36]|uniref:hypothetical protein n=1 Tax=Streptomyces sp. cg36 TaxID=3238798 RepID=UPI0034E28823
MAGTGRSAAEARAAGTDAGPRSPDGPAEGASPEPVRLSPDDGAATGEAGGASVVRRVAGRARRCTAVAPVGACVSEGRGRDGADDTGVTRTPRSPRTGAFTCAPDGFAPTADAAGRAARWTGADDALAGVTGAAPAPAAVGTPGGGGAGVPVAAGIARSGATGMRWATGAALEPNDPVRTGCSPAAPGCRSGAVNPAASRPPLAAGSSTAGDGAPMNDGFCHVGRRPPNPASATPARVPPVTRWIGGSCGQAATVAGAAVTASAARGPGPVGTAATGPAPAVPVPSPRSSRRPRSRSRIPTAQPSPAPRATRDAIWSV